MCYKKIKISYGLKIIFKKSQHILEKYVSLLHNSDNCSNDESSPNPENSLEEDDKNSEINSEGSVNVEITEEELPLSDYVILQVTDDNEEEEIKEEQENLEENEESDSKSSKITAELIDSNQYKIKKIISKSKMLYNCPFCKKSLLTKRKLDQHTKICQKYTLEKCELCDQQFSSVMRKYYHVKMKHSNDSCKEVKCEVCDEVFENPKARTYHCKTKHALKKFACKICGKAFHFKNGLTMHMDTHTKDQYKEICPECGKGFHYRGKFLFLYNYIL